MDLMFQPLRKYADFQGRARRLEYWLFALLLFIIECAAGGVALVAGVNTPTYWTINSIMVVVALATLIPSLAVTVRRLHDTNRSAWWILINLLPIIGSIVLVVFMLLDGTPGPNRFGPDPKGRGLPAGVVA